MNILEIAKNNKTGQRQIGQYKVQLRFIDGGEVQIRCAVSPFGSKSSLGYWRPYALGKDDILADWEDLG